MISGNAGNGVHPKGVSATVADYNWIGLNAAGPSAMPNGSDGIQFDGGASGILWQLNAKFRN
jgi:hypothetical protein